LRKSEKQGRVAHLEVQPMLLPVLPLVLPGSGKEACAAPPEEDPTDGAGLADNARAKGAREPDR